MALHKEDMQICEAVIFFKSGKNYNFSNIYFFLSFWFSLCSSSCPETHSVVQAGLKFSEIYLSLPPKCWD